jgi:hypothetical protein
MSLLECLVEVLFRMSGLKTLYLYGSPMFLHNLVSKLPDLAPRLEGVTIRSVSAIHFTGHIIPIVHTLFLDTIDMMAECTAPGYQC